MVNSAKNNSAKMKKLVAVVALSLSASLYGPAVQAAGLGKLNVLSSLGQPLQAEVDLVSLQKGELESLVARVATPEAFREAGLEYAGALNNIKFAVERRSNGQPYLRISSSQPVNEPVLDLLIDLSWSSGRLLREYPILLDPPGFAANRVATAPIVAPPITQSAPVVQAAPPAITYTQPPVPQPVVTSADISQPVVSQPASTQTVAQATQQPVRGIEGATYGPVKPGETLYSIAQQNKPEMITVDQMLVAIYRQNKQAFLNNNMNFLKKGQILKMPSQEEATTLAAPQATKEVRVQTANWNSYRQKLAEAVTQSPAKPQGAPQTAGGKIGSTVEPKAPADAGKEVVKLSKGDAPTGKEQAGKPDGKASQEKITALQEEAIRRENALKEANSRVKDLEKTVEDMKKLLALKSGTMAQAQNQAAAKATDPKAADAKTPANPADAKAPEAKPTDAKTVTKPADAKVADAKATDKKPEAVKPPEAKPADVKPGEVKPAEAKPASKPVVAAAPVAEASILDTVFDNIVPILGGVAGLGAIGGLLAFMRKKKSNRTLAELDDETGDTLAADLKVPSQGTPTAGVVDTSGDSSFLTDFDKTGPGVIDTEEVDPVAEADVYMAYGRDAQAEEILKEAMAKDSERHEIPLKLLEIYSTRGSKGAFENVAKEMHKAVGDSHPLWEKVREMGLRLDPGNALYGGAAAAALLAGSGALSGLDISSDKTLPARPENMAAATQAAAPSGAPDIDFDFLSDDAGAKPAAGAATDFDLNAGAGATAGADMMDLDFGATTPVRPGSSPDLNLAAAASAAKPDVALDMPDLDLGLGSASVAADAGMDFPLTTESKAPGASSDSLMDFPLTADKKVAGGSDLDFDFTSAPGGKAADMPLDISDLSLDLNAPMAGTAAVAGVAAAVAGSGAPTASAARRPEAQWQSAATKLDLARAYLEIGDKEGAKEILQEVLTLGNADQQKAAKELVTSLT